MERMAQKRCQVAEALRAVCGPSGDREILVEQVMTRRPNCVPPSTSVLELVRSLHSYRFRHLLVVDDDGNLLGVVSDRDVVRCFGVEEFPAEETLASISAGTIMSTDLITIRPDMRLDHAIDLMLEYGINCLPVNVGERPIGILTTTDLYVVAQALLESLRQPQTAEPPPSAVLPVTTEPGLTSVAPTEVRI